MSFNAKFNAHEMVEDDIEDGHHGHYNFGTDPISPSANVDYGNDYSRVQKSRERNREHAKRTRLRKKAVLEVMKERLLALQNEASRLQQAFDESNTANILLCLSVCADPGQVDESQGMEQVTSRPEIFETTSHKGNIIDHLRTTVRAEAAQYQQQQQLIKSSQLTESSGSSTSVVSVQNDPCSDDDLDSEHSVTADGAINWKNGTIISQKGAERKLTAEELETLRKERNRMHAKLTRDRKKLFTSRIQQMISSLERQNAMMRNRLKGLATVGQRITREAVVTSDSASSSGSTASPTPSEHGSN